MTGSSGPIGVRPPDLARSALTVLTVAVGLQCLRAMLPVAYTYREEHGVAAVAAVATLVFLTPALGPVLVRRSRPATTGVAVAGALVIARLAVQVADPVSLALAATAAALGLLAITVTVAPTPDGRAPALGLLGGLALDAALRSAFATWDPVWQHTTAAWTVTAAMLLGLLAAALADRRHAGAEAASAPADRTSIGLALGPLLALQVLFLQNLGAVAAAGGLALAAALAAVLVADGLAALAVLGTTRAPLPRGGVATVTIVAAFAVGALPSATGARFVGLVLVAQVMVTTLYARAAASDREPHTARAVGSAAAGGAVMGTTLFLYQLHYDRPLPADNRWLLVGAAAVIGLAALVARPIAAEGRAPRRVRGAAATALVAVGAAFVIGVALGEPGVETTPAGTTLRVATFNVHNGVTRDGQLDLQAIARHIEAVDPDVLVVEEVDRGWLLGATTDVAEWLRRRLGMPYEWAPAADQQMGNAIFHRVPLRDAEVVRLPKGSGTMRRSGLVARVGPVDGEPVTIIGVHFQNGSTAAHKDTRIREADTLLAAWGGGPHAVLLGDFNMDPGERDLRHLLAAGFDSTQPTDRCTLPTSNDNCVDWILVTDDMDQGRPVVRRADEFDHDPVLTTVRPR